MTAPDVLAHPPDNCYVAAIMAMELMMLMMMMMKMVAAIASALGYHDHCDIDEVDEVDNVGIGSKGIDDMIDGFEFVAVGTLAYCDAFGNSLDRANLAGTFLTAFLKKAALLLGNCC